VDYHYELLHGLLLQKIERVMAILVWVHASYGYNDDERGWRWLLLQIVAMKQKKEE
jgi:hypothetical protein